MEINKEHMEIGDWVFDNHTNKDCIQPIQITEDILKDGDLSGLSPIPLTDEIFDKNGFVKTDYGYQISNNLHFTATNDVIKYTYVLMVVNNDGVAMKTNAGINYVHELQRFLDKIIGDKRKINLNY